jgi:hypothetical protein
VVLLEEAGRPVGVAPAGKWILIPPLEVEVDWSGYLSMGIHFTEKVHQFPLDFFISKRLSALSPITLEMIQYRRRQPQKSKREHAQ